MQHKSAYHAVIGCQRPSLDLGSIECFLLIGNQEHGCWSIAERKCLPRSWVVFHLCGGLVGFPCHKAFNSPIQMK